MLKRNWIYLEFRRQFGAGVTWEGDLRPEEHSFREKPSGAPQEEKGEAATQTNGSAPPKAHTVSNGMRDTGRVFSTAVTQLRAGRLGSRVGGKARSQIKGHRHP